jgi:hypothetical protein
MDALQRIFGAVNLATEVTRAANEFLSLKLVWNCIHANAPQGDDHPIFVLPGFLARDVTTIGLRNRLTQMGYNVYAWENGANLGLSPQTAHHLQQRLETISRDNRGQKVSIIGHSLGGVYARELARENPDLVRSVITLGSPFGMTPDNNTTPEFLNKLYNFLNPDASIHMAEILNGRSLTPPPVPTTSLFSKQDGVVHWTASLNPRTVQSENIEIFSSHVGMIINPLAVAAILDRLSQKEDEWAPYNRDHLPWYLSILYPESVTDDKLPKNPAFDMSAHGTKPLFA